MPLHLNPKVRGKYMKLGTGWVKLSDVISSEIAQDSGRRKLIVHRHGKPPIVYDGDMTDLCKLVLDRETLP